MRHCSRNAIAGAVCRNPDVLRSTHEKLSRGAQCSLQLRVLGFGLLQDGNVGVGPTQCGLVSLHQNVLTLFGRRLQFAELRSSADLHE
jgi:hypothetical protein